ncbi:MAG TPA: alpha/beta hydrolase [Acidimicrobiales bacterium]|jgi:pimeloyl-ACP methyl ester carboxylesterase|nr:alpha/beta hydrolase [Acidimicrobiales bacterium]
MTSFVDVAGRKLAYATWGDPGGFPVFALHGTPGCRLNRHPVDEKVAATGVRLITYDRPGYGQSERHAGRRVVDCVGDVAAIADDLGIDRFAVTGGSGGGPHSLAVAARLPERVLRARCVVGLVPYGTPNFDWLAGMDPENVKEFGWALAGEDTLIPELEREAAALVERVKADPTRALEGFELSDADRAAMADPVRQQIMTEAIPETFANGVWGWADDDLAFAVEWGFDVGEITVPTEVWYGATDVLVPAAHGAWLAEHVPGAIVKVEQAKGHMSLPDEELDNLRALADAARS